MQDIDDLDIGYLMDLLIEQSNSISQAKKAQERPRIRKATQADFDAM
ncbi:hypothetical protein AAK706_01450 [Erysipelotrichaceae bacterium 66-17]